LEEKHGKGWLKANGGGNRKRYAVRSLVALHGPTPALEFGSVKLKTVKDLAKGEFDAGDNPPREDIAEETVLATLPFMPKPLDSVIRLMLLTGGSEDARSGPVGSHQASRFDSRRERRVRHV
jgi:hypothetical protein